jgi:hypothetical protein
MIEWQTRYRFKNNVNLLLGIVSFVTLEIKANREI